MQGPQLFHWQQLVAVPCPFFFKCYVCQIQLLETGWQRVKQEHGIFQLLHAEKEDLC